MKARGNRADVVVLTTGCHHPAHELSIKAIPESIRRSLEALDTGYLDIWAFHRDNLEVPVEAIVDVLNAEVAAGARLRCVELVGGAYRGECVRGEAGAMDGGPGPRCLRRRRSRSGRMHFATEEDLGGMGGAVARVAWSSQGRGFFLDSSGPEDTNADLVRVYHNEANFARLARARELAKQKGVAAVQIALAYVLNLPAPIIALVGPETPAQMDMCVEGAGIGLTEAEMEWLAVGARAGQRNLAKAKGKGERQRLNGRESKECHDLDRMHT
jgi:aryl-alcohol dehydrogenase-like predicted oxidoreductase